ncbi:uncharacterized protein E0L32_004207 [Thyridium curvatum]|uniref:Heterokaryon incompatibility domain-containing protein n=1 Tax=Thyridium curvatum TaxID=1093900 RepID=A0A507B1Q8_9PEZI|nr:uncharacterized protein E0L32_004207 [Thyridium curvatum]TPX16212.1 hypothetical protein E0L32_004207 [Thyridium curvatum]
MSRWHTDSCITPDVYVEDSTPRCRSCGSAPDLAKLIAEQSTVNSPWTVPPDEEFGHMNLHWPATVPYKTLQSTDRQDNDNTLATDEISPGCNTEDRDQPLASSPAYDTIAKNHLRLLSLPAMANVEHDCIHATLHTYQLDDCPEYETVSYCWGGEDGEMERCRPIYLTAYWDVLLQTKNCWSLLKYLQLRTEPRLVWVDAICINQANIEEREIQVGHMGEIYRRCLRVVVYLGESIACSQELGRTERKYPARYDLQDINNHIPASVMDLKKLFSLRYFRRLWIVQELVLAPMAIIPILGIEFMASAATVRHPSISGNFPRWTDFICSRNLDFGQSLREVLMSTRESEATDIRDKVFGLLGFLTEAPDVPPDYSISAIHTFIGTIAYMVISEGCLDLLTYASGHLASADFPSWLPDWTLSTLGAGLSHLTTCAAVGPSEGDASQTLRKMRFDNPQERFFMILHPGKSLQGHLQAPGEVAPSATRNAKECSITVDPASAALSIEMIHLCNFASPPISCIWKRHYPPCRMFKIKTGLCWIYLLVPGDVPLDQVIEPGPNQAFLLPGLEKSRNYVAILQQRPSLNSFKLVKFFVCHYISFSTNWSPSRHFKFPDPMTACSYELLSHRVYGTIKDIQSHLEELWRQRCLLLDHIFVALSMKIKQAAEWRQRAVSMGNKFQVYKELCSLFDSLHRDSQAGLDDFLRYLRRNAPDCRTWTDRQKVFLTIDYEDWFRVSSSLLPNFSRMYLDSYPAEDALNIGSVPRSGWGWRFLSRHQDQNDGSKDRREDPPWEWGFLGGFEMSPNSISGPVEIVFDGEALARLLSHSEYAEPLRKLRICSRLVGKDETSLALDEPDPKYQSVCYFDWPDCFLDNLESLGHIRTVTIT